MTVSYWLLKTEPTSYSIDDLAAAPQQTTRYVPTLRVPAGKSISVFVARDLEFPGGARR